MNPLTKLFFATVIISVIFLSCKKDKKIGALGPNFPYAVNSVITPAMLDTFTKHGLPINSGLNPPVINGIYREGPTYCLFDNSQLGIQGDTVNDEKFKFSDQNTSTFTLNIAYKDSSGEFGTDNNATFISGSGNLFTIFALLKDSLSGAGDVQLRVISGEIATGGIKNLFEGLYIESRGYDVDGEIAEEGTFRIFKDADGFSPSESSFSTVAAVLHKPRSNKQQFIFTGAAGKRN
jgi:hypothetical protein